MNTHKEINTYSMEKSIYGTDEICLVPGIYGKTSQIYISMANGKKISQMVKDTMTQKDALLPLKYRLYGLCVKREQKLDSTIDTVHVNSQHNCFGEFECKNNLNDRQL